MRRSQCNNAPSPALLFAPNRFRQLGVQMAGPQQISGKELRYLLLQVVYLLPQSCKFGPRIPANSTRTLTSIMLLPNVSPVV